MEKPVWKVLSSSRIIESPYLNVRKDEVQLPDGSVLDYYVRESTGFTMVFALTEEKNVVLIREYRYGFDAVLLECPAGTFNANESPLECAQRELREETGYTAQRWEKLFTLPSEPSRSNAVMHGFLALDARKTGTTEHDRSEHIETFLCPLAEFPSALETATATMETSVATSTLAHAALSRLRALGML